MSGRRRSMTLALVATVGLLPATPTGAFTTECRYGVNAHQAQDTALDLAAAAGIGWVRFDLNWFQFEPSRDQYEWGEADRFVAKADALGLHVFFTAAYTPPWAASVPCNDADPEELNWCRNAVPVEADWIDFLTEALGRFGGSVKHWGLWNEPNLTGFFRGTRDEYVTTILVPGAATVHAVCPTCLVLGPELANLRSGWDEDEGQCVMGECAFNGWNYSLIQILQAAGTAIDIITHHRYDDPVTDWWAEILDGETIVVQIMNGLKEVTDQHGQGQPVWITEVGWESEPFGDHTNAYAASQLTALFEGLEAVRAGTYPGPANQPWPELEKIFWYDLVDDPGGYSWGLLTSELTPKDPYAAYAAAIQALGDCSGTGPGPDAGPGTDAAPNVDAGSGTDAAPNVDAGSGADAAPGVDSAPGADAGPDPDNGSGGCGCRTGGTAGGGVVWLVGLWLAWRRRRRPKV